MTPDGVHLVVFPKNPLHWDRVKAPAVEFPQVGPMLLIWTHLRESRAPGLSRGPSGKDFWERPLGHVSKRSLSRG